MRLTDVADIEQMFRLIESRCQEEIGISDRTFCNYSREGFRLFASCWQNSRTTRRNRRLWTRWQSKELNNNARFSCISAIFLVSLHLERQSLRQISQRQKPRKPSLLAAAARHSHVRRKILPRPPQDFATGGANLLPPVSFPVTSRVNPCTLGVFPPFPP